MKQIFVESSALELIPASVRHLSVLDATSTVDDLLSECGAKWRTHFRQLYLEDKQQDVKVAIDLYWLSLLEIDRLAAGEELRTPYGQVEAAGRLRLLRGHEGGNLVVALLEFLPDEAVPQGMAFDPWWRLRFPEYSPYLSGLDHEEWWVLLHELWAEETCPASTLAPDDSLLLRAVLSNHEEWVEAILKRQPRIEVRPGAEKSMQQTALGVAMENTGIFGVGPGFACGCHRYFRDDDFTHAEDRKTWVPRAERIGGMLRDAGAVDYSPLLDACRTGDLAEALRMLDDGFPANFSIYGATTALVEAASHGHVEICKLMLEWGADPNQPRVFDTSMTWGGLIYPLTCALRHPEISAMLLEAGADPNSLCDDDRETPVIFKSRYETQDAADALFSRVDFSSIRGKLGMTGVHILPTEDLTLCRKYIPSELLEQRNQAGMTPLHSAYLYKDLAKVKLLLGLGADPDPQGIIWGLKEEDWGFFPISGRYIAFGSLADAASFEGETELLDALQSADGKLDGTLWVIDIKKKLAEDVLEAARRKLEEDRQLLVEEGREILQIPDSDFQCACYHSLLSPNEHELLNCLVTYLFLDPESTLQRYPELMGKFTLDAQSKWQGPFSEKPYPQLSDLIRELSEEEEED